MVGVANANATPQGTMPAVVPFSPTAQVRSPGEGHQGTQPPPALRTTLDTSAQPSMSHSAQFYRNVQIR